MLIKLHTVLCIDAEKRLIHVNDVVLSGIISGSLEDCYDELGSRYQLPVYVLAAPTNLQLDSSDVDELPEKLSPSSKKRKRGSELPIRLQLSTGPVMRLTVRTNDSVLLVRQHVAAMTDVSVGGVRLFFAGKQLTDNTRLKDAGLRKNYTIQAVLSGVGLSEACVGTDPTGADVAELSSELPSELQRTLSTSTDMLPVSAEQVEISAAAVPTTGCVENVDEMQMSAALVPSTESEELAVVDLPTTSSLPRVVESSYCGLDTAL